MGEASATQDGGGGGGGGGGSASDVSLFGASDSNAATTLRAPRSTRSRPVTSSGGPWNQLRSEEHTSELQSLMRISYAVFCLKKKKKTKITHLRKQCQKQQHRNLQSENSTK